MFWQEDKEDTSGYQVPDEIVDISFKLNGKNLPLDHAYALSEAMKTALPWLADEEDAGVHLIHVAESGNGWYRPEDVENELLHLSRRTRMTLRLPQHRLDDARELEGTTLDIEGFELVLSDSSIKKLSALGTQFSRHVITDPDQSEEAFLYQVAEEIESLGIKVRKMLAGKSHAFRTPDGPLHTRSVMLADLEPEQAVLLQQKGIGSGRKMGCGIFIPHKGINSVDEKQ